jgi:hypothetical protein
VGERDVDEADVIAAHKHSSRHRAELEASERCGCFYCLAMFALTEIKSWLNEGDGTALCPRCMIDSVIGSASGYPVTTEFLGRMHRHWFNGLPPDKTA